MHRNRKIKGFLRIPLCDYLSSISFSLLQLISMFPKSPFFTDGRKTSTIPYSFPIQKRYLNLSSSKIERNAPPPSEVLSLQIRACSLHTSKSRAYRCLELARPILKMIFTITIAIILHPSQCQIKYALMAQNIFILGATRVKMYQTCYASLP